MRVDAGTGDRVSPCGDNRYFQVTRVLPAPADVSVKRSVLEVTGIMRPRRDPLRIRVAFIGACLFVACAPWEQRQLDQRFGSADPTRFDDRAAVAPKSSTGASPSFRKDVLPILERRCVVCHGCYDAPCQLKLGSWEGVTRGASQNKVHEGDRLREAKPTRLFEDAQKPSDWRRMSFFPMLNERNADAQTNLAGSLLYRLLELKRRHPSPKTGVLPPSLDFSVDRKQICPNLTQIGEFETQHPDWGMPFGLPGLDANEHELISRWLEQGAPEGDKPPPMDAGLLVDLQVWETFLGGDSLKAQLVARYLYEHLFLATIHFESDKSQTRFRLVRSATPPGQPIQVIPTRRPYDDPHVHRVYYRLAPIRETNVEKTDMRYVFGPQRLARLKSLFFDTPYDVTELPSYKPEVATNPFLAFAAIPTRLRYQFLIDNAQFTMMGFIKGPVCRGQLALNVIEDQFWVFFVAPHKDPAEWQDAFFKREAKNLSLPAAWGSGSPIVIPWLEYKHRQDDFLMAKSHYLEKALAPRKIDLSLIWDGDGTNPNAALTVFRHFNSATVVQGLVGAEPKTVWVLSYSEFERIHYLLVAGYDVFGNIGHHLNTRLYMDFLRMQAEFNFLVLLPQKSRKQVRDLWYRGASDSVKEHVYGGPAHLDRESDVPYKTDNPKRELLALLSARLAPVLKTQRTPTSSDPLIGRDLEDLSSVRGPSLSFLPESVVLRIDGADDQKRYFTILRNTGHSNVSELLREEERILPAENTLTVAPGFIGAYPNALYVVAEAEVPNLTEAIAHLASEADYKHLADRFAIRRTHPDFWRHADAMQSAHAEADGGHHGLLDLSRFENR